MKIEVDASDKNVTIEVKDKAPAEKEQPKKVEENTGDTGPTFLVEKTPF